MKLLIVGGTVFLGRRLIEAAVERGHDVTIFNRGRHNPDVFPQIERLRGDRNTDLAALRGRQWDSVVDTCGFTPGSVRHVVQLLRDSVSHYTFISSVSVYSEFLRAGIDENAPVDTITAEQVNESEAIATGDRPSAPTYGQRYGALKALCEQTAEEAMPGRVLNIRPGLIVGAHDYTDRFTYWVRRVSRGGDVLAPGKPERRVRVIDARDLAQWTLRMTERRQAGVYNATGAEDGLTMEGMLTACRIAGGHDARLVWAAEPFLVEQNVQAWTELPLWIPEAHNGIFEVRNDKAIAADLSFRPLIETVRDTLSWDATRRHLDLRSGLTQKREQELLGALSR